MSRKQILPEVAGRVDCGVEAGLNVRPVALVLVFLLGPHQLGVRVLGTLGLDQIVREGRDLVAGQELIDFKVERLQSGR